MVSGHDGGECPEHHIANFVHYKILSGLTTIVTIRKDTNEGVVALLPKCYNAHATCHVRGLVSFMLRS